MKDMEQKEYGGDTIDPTINGSTRPLWCVNLT